MDAYRYAGEAGPFRFDTRYLTVNIREPDIRSYVDLGGLGSCHRGLSHSSGGRADPLSPPGFGKLCFAHHCLWLRYEICREYSKVRARLSSLCASSVPPSDSCVPSTWSFRAFPSHQLSPVSTIMVDIIKLRRPAESRSLPLVTAVLITQFLCHIRAS